MLCMSCSKPCYLLQEANTILILFWTELGQLKLPWKNVYWLEDCRVTVESVSLLSEVDCFPVTAIAAVTPGGTSVESIRPAVNCFTALADVADGTSAESPLPPVFSAAMLGGISTTITSCDPSTMPTTFGRVAGFSGSSALWLGVLPATTSTDSK